MTGDFAYFPRLPAELRLEIWRLAIRPARIKSVQFFGIQDTHFNQTEDSEPAYPIMEDERYVLTAPGFQSGPWRLKRNESGYTLDAGLWTACVESREVIQRHHKVNHYEEPKPKYLRSGFEHSSHFWCPRHGDCQVKDKNTSLLSYPEAELFCFQIEDGQLFDESFYYRFRTVRLLLNAISFRIPKMGYYLGVPSIAFEYDTSWEFGDKTMSISNLFQAGGSRGCFLRFLDAAIRFPFSEVKLHIIDRSIVHQVDVDSLVEHKHEFETNENRYYRIIESNIIAPRKEKNAFEFLEDSCVLFKNRHLHGHNRQTYGHPYPTPPCGFCPKLVTVLTAVSKKTG